MFFKSYSYQWQRKTSYPTSLSPESTQLTTAPNALKY